MCKDIEKEHKGMLPHTKYDQRVDQKHLLLFFQSETLLCPALKVKCIFIFKSS